MRFLLIERLKKTSPFRKDIDKLFASRKKSKDEQDDVMQSLTQLNNE